MPVIPVPAGNIDVVVTGIFGPAASFQVYVTPPQAPGGWATTVDVVNGADQFTLNFSIPAPPGATIGYTVIGVTPSPFAAASTLQDYLDRVRRLLRDEDPNRALYSTTDLTAWVNEAMQQRDVDLGLNRARISFAMTQGIYQYAIATIVTNGTVLTGPTNPNIIDFISITVVPLGGGPGALPRYPLSRVPYSELAFLLATNNPTYPVAYAMYGTGHVMVGPPPAGNYFTEWDGITHAPELVNPLDADPQPYPWTQPIPFYAAHLAKLGAQRFDEAQAFQAKYQESLGRVRSRGRPFAVRQPWRSSLLRRW